MPPAVPPHARRHSSRSLPLPLARQLSDYLLTLRMLYAPARRADSALARQVTGRAGASSPNARHVVYAPRDAVRRQRCA